LEIFFAKEIGLFSVGFVSFSIAVLLFFGLLLDNIEYSSRWFIWKIYLAFFNNFRLARWRYGYGKLSKVKLILIHSFQGGILIGLTLLVKG